MSFTFHIRSIGQSIANQHNHLRLSATFELRYDWFRCRYSEAAACVVSSSKFRSKVFRARLRTLHWCVCTHCVECVCEVFSTIKYGDMTQWYDRSNSIFNATKYLTYLWIMSHMNFTMTTTILDSIAERVERCWQSPAYANYVVKRRYAIADFEWDHGLFEIRIWSIRILTSP